MYLPGIKAQEGDIVLDVELVIPAAIYVDMAVGAVHDMDNYTTIPTGRFGIGKQYKGYLEFYFGLNFSHLNLESQKEDFVLDVFKHTSIQINPSVYARVIQYKDFRFYLGVSSSLLYLTESKGTKLLDRLSPTFKYDLNSFTDYSAGVQLSGVGKYYLDDFIGLKFGGRWYQYIQGRQVVGYFLGFELLIR